MAPELRRGGVGDLSGDGRGPVRGGVQGSPTHARGLARHPGSESLPVETMTDGEDTSRHTIDTILEVLEGSASLESALPSGGDDGTVWWSVLVPGSGHTVGDPVRSLVLITLVTMAITIWFSAVVGVSRALWGTLTRGWSLTGARASGNGPSR